MKRFDEATVREPKGFTLVELLTVIVVIAILVSLLMPALSNIRERARCTKCVANLKQLHEAAMNYATDNSRLPAGASYERLQPTDGTWAKQGTGWLDWYSYVPATATGDARTYFNGANGQTCITNGTLYSYLQDMRIYLCPTFSQSKVCGVADAVRSYGMCDQASEVYLSTIRNASRLLLFSEQSTWNNAPREYGKFIASGQDSHWTLIDNGDNIFSVPPTRVYSAMYGMEGRRRYIEMDGVLDGFIQAAWNVTYVLEHLGAYHDGRANCIFVDGHTEKIWYTNTASVCSGSWGAVE